MKMSKTKRWALDLDLFWLISISLFDTSADQTMWVFDPVVAIKFQNICPIRSLGIIPTMKIKFSPCVAQLLLGASTVPGAFSGYCNW
jgi:hypothetical protein